MTGSTPTPSNDVPSNEVPSNQVDNAFPKARVVVATALILGLVVFALLLPIPYGGRIVSSVGDMVHAPLFGSLGLIWIWAWQNYASKTENSESKAIHRGRRLVIRGLVVWLSVTVFGVLMEYLQGSMGRSMSRHDAIANSLGVAAGIALYTAYDFSKRNRRVWAKCFLAISVAILAAAWKPPVMVLWDVFTYPSQYPLLASFETEEEMGRWYDHHLGIRRVRQGATDGDSAAEVTFAARPYSMVTLLEFVKDWSDAEALELDLTMDASNRESSVLAAIKLEFEEGYGKQFVKRFEIPRGETVRVVLPFEEVAVSRDDGKFDSKQLSLVHVMVFGAPAPTKIRFDRLRLVLTD